MDKVEESRAAGMVEVEVDREGGMEAGKVGKVEDTADMVGDKDRACREADKRVVEEEEEENKDEVCKEFGKMEVHRIWKEVDLYKFLYKPHKIRVFS